MRLAPDQTIYINTFGGNNVYLHQIKEPDKPWPACHMVQRAVRLKAENAGSLPLSANDKLGPVIGSACDSIYRLKEHWDLEVSPTIADRRIKIWSRTSLEFSIPLEFRIYDPLGRLAFRKSLNAQSLPVYLELDAHPAGMYVYTLLSGGQLLKTGRFILP